MSKIFRKFVLTLLAVLPIPNLSMAAYFSEVSPKEDSKTAESAFLRAVENETLPESFYQKMKELDFVSIDDIFLLENKGLYRKFVEAYRKYLNGEIIMASSTISQLGGGQMH